MSALAILPQRGVVEVTGTDRIPFLQGLVSNDIAEAKPGEAVWTALLTPQGKWVADFFVIADGERLLLDCERAQAGAIIQRLQRYRLRSDAMLRDLSGELVVAAAWNGAAPAGAAPGGHATPSGHATIVARDHRLPEAGWRVIGPAAGIGEVTAGADDYDLHRLMLGLPDGSRDLEAEKTVLLEAGFDELNGVSWTKGCYMGQELTARTKYRGLVKRRLVPVGIEGRPPAPGTPIERDGVEVGSMRSSREHFGLALLRIEVLETMARLRAGDATLTPRRPVWMRLPQPA
jgi:folate-binding protein YgfZ